MSIPNDVPSYRPRWLWWSLPENFSTYDEYRSHLLSTGKFDGSPLHEIISLLFLGPFSVFLTWGFVTWNLGSLHSTSQINSKLLLVFEFGFILLTALIALTAGCDQPASILAAVIVAAFGFFLAIDRREGVMTAAGRKSRTVVESFRLFRALNLPSQQTPGDPAGIDGILRQSVAEYRTLVLVVTVICILAVDFPAVFPDKFHKSAKFGTSIMDLGVGGFIVANGLVAREARSLTTLPGVKKPSVRQRFQAQVESRRLADGDPRSPRILRRFSDRLLRVDSNRDFERPLSLAPDRQLRLRPLDDRQLLLSARPFSRSQNGNHLHVIPARYSGSSSGLSSHERHQQ